MFHRIDTVLIPFSNCGTRGWEISKYHLAFNQNSWHWQKWKKLRYYLLKKFQPIIIWSVIVYTYFDQSKQSSSPDRTTKISDVLLWIFLIEIKIIKTRFGDTKSRIRPNQTLSIKLKTLHVIIVKKFLVEAAFRIKIMYQLFMKALWFLELFALKGNLVANIKNVQKD